MVIDERALSVTATGTVRDVAVGVDITHTCIGDVEVSLVSPAGTTVKLHQRTGGSVDNLLASYAAATTPGLATLSGQPIQGAWRLKVADRDRVDTGQLNRWSLRIDRQP